LSEYEEELINKLINNPLGPSNMVANEPLGTMDPVALIDQTLCIEFAFELEGMLKHPIAHEILHGIGADGKRKGHRGIDANGKSKSRRGIGADSTGTGCCFLQVLTSSQVTVPLATLASYADGTFATPEVAAQDGAKVTPEAMTLMFALYLGMVMSPVRFWRNR